MSAHDIDDLEARFGSHVRQVRIASGTSQEELARSANVSRSAISSLESGAGSSLATLIKVLRALGRSEWLLTLDAPAEVFNPLELLDQRRAPKRKGPPRVARARSGTATGIAP